MALGASRTGFIVYALFVLSSISPLSLLRVLLVVLAVLPVFAPLADPQSSDASARRRPLLGLVYSAAARYHVDPRLLDAVIQTESSYRIHVTSSAGAVGLMQLMPRTARRYGVTTRFDPVQNVLAGTRYLRDLLREFDLELALAAYNAGEGAVRRHRGIPPYPETRAYVRRVLDRYAALLQSPRLVP